MMRNVLESIAGIELYPVISLVIFLAVFTGMVVWVLRRDTSYINEMSAMPIDADDADMNSTQIIS
ncbi:MAG: cbb3-type cytochrome c oxidase subunit 3 [Candidatus Kapabacteria bacterium]|nr:cbb3-type cytochrome c oxidase subunit 3 [Candidatus Kapabacteria bacterium]